ncbi:MAG: hypothetical protein IJ776_11160 [Paludibacteraceae bacterium]|nr:hypothetical protein [Paludibacteraceae bacterium]
MDKDDNIINRREGDFTTSGIPTALDDAAAGAIRPQPIKVIENDKVYILMPDGRRYSVTGTEVK